VATNPVVGGSGTNLKLVEYLAAGAPVVSTPHGARGLGGQDGVHLALAGPDEFLDALDAVLADPAAADERAVAARALVEERFDWHVLARRLAASIKAVL
jgi:glycosyltransferase involved in cell wall biosynthesis